MTTLGARFGRQLGPHNLTFDLAPGQLTVHRNGDLWATLVPGDTLFVSFEGETVRFDFPWPWRRPEPVVEPQPNGDLNIRFNHNATTTDLAETTRRLNVLLDDFDRLNQQAQLRLTPEAQEAHQRLVAEQRALRERRELESRAAEAKAKKLLFSHLSDEQRKQFGKTNWFEVKGQHLTYQISAYGVDTVKPRGTFCIGPLGRVPRSDEVLALKLMIESDEAEFLRVANWSGRSGEYEISLGRMGIDGVPSQDVFRSRIYGGGSMRRNEHGFGQEMVAEDVPWNANRYYPITNAAANTTIPNAFTGLRAMLTTATETAPREATQAILHTWDEI